jgi:hypothetical protein
MKIMDILRKLGVFRSGTVAKKYKSGKDMPAELLMDDVYDADKDLVTKDDVQHVHDAMNEHSKKNKKKIHLKRSIFFWSVTCIAVFFVLAHFDSGFSINMVFTFLLWVGLLFYLRRFAFTLEHSFVMMIIAVIVVFFISLTLIPSQSTSTDQAIFGDDDAVVVSVESEDNAITGTIGIQKKINKKTGEPYLHATYNLLIAADLPFNSLCGGYENKPPRCDEYYEYSTQLVRADGKYADKGNGVASPVYCNTDTLGDPFSTTWNIHTLEACDISTSDGIYGLKTNTFLAQFATTFASYEDIMNSTELNLYSYAEFWEPVDDVVDGYHGNTDLPVQNSQPARAYTMIFTD